MTDQYLIHYNIPDKPVPPDAKIFINGAVLTLKQFMEAAQSYNEERAHGKHEAFPDLDAATCGNCGKHWTECQCKKEEK